ncbi:Voltage-dependent calcium channel subunit alpha-2/delta-4 [Porites harrisoni]
MITLVAPVFNKTEHKELLGVVGTDVALPQLEDTVPGSEVGANGYGFAINNNGFVLFHPALDKEVKIKIYIFLKTDVLQW